jgi:site-specific recombinase XerC
MVVNEPIETRLIADMALDSVIVLDSVTSPESKRAYRRALRDFVMWYGDTGQTVIHKAAVQRYAAELSQQGMSAQNINQRLSARNLALNGVAARTARGAKAVQLSARETWILRRGYSPSVTSRQYLKPNDCQDHPR